MTKGQRKTRTRLYRSRSLPFATKEERNAARELYADCSADNITIDDDAAVSEADYGVWVQAWVFVHDDDVC